jgi:thiamine kinase-like enzyme
MAASIIPKRILAEIEKSLSAKIVGVERVAKIYGSNAESFLLTVSSPKNKTTTYFLKLEDGNRTRREVAGTRFIEQSLPVPKILSASRGKSSPSGWILFERVRGNLMAEKYLNIKSESDFGSFCELERRKENHLKALYSQPGITMSRKDYAALPANRLFRERLCGERYENFFAGKKNNISRYFDRNISINGHSFPLTINEIFQSIKDKYSSRENKTVVAYMGHGDAHHGNIISNRGLKFIDNEYAGFIPPFMELAKPYYNDFIGILFFHHHPTLDQHFRIERFEDTGTKLLFKIAPPKKITSAIKITEIKLSSRKKWVNARTDEFLSLNDYLILCHALTKNPNVYPPNAQLLFLAFMEILAQFDPLDPESIYHFL